MIVYDNKVFVHINKCMGTSIYKYCFHPRNVDKVSFTYGLHCSYHQVGKIHANLPAYSLVRNPLTWYESVYNYEMDFVLRKKSMWMMYPLFLKEINPTGTLPDKIYHHDLVNVYEFLDRALHFKEFFAQKGKWNFVQEKLKKNWNWNYTKSLLLDFRAGSPQEETLYEFFVERYGIFETKWFRMEDQLPEFCKEFNIDQRGLRRENVTVKHHRFTSENLSKIKKYEKKLMERFGYGTNN